MESQALPPEAAARVLALDARGALSHAAFWGRVASLRAAVHAHPARRWALVCEDSGWFAAGLLALADPKRTVVLPQAPKPGSVQDAAVEAVLTDRPSELVGFPCLPVDGSSEVVPAGAARFPDDAAAVEFYTSGSSGAPKCVPTTWAQLRLAVAGLERQWGLALGDAAVAGTVPHYHLYGLLFRVLWPLYSGRPFHLPLCQQPADLRAAAARGRCAVVSSPAFLSRLQDFSELPPASKVAAVFSSGAPLSDEAAEQLAGRWGHAAIEVYGSTETGGVGWRAWSGSGDRALWRAIKGVDTELRQEATGARLWVRSGCTWRGDWMPTGDLARDAGEGRFILLGRADDVVKFEDKRLSLAEMRARLVQHAWVADARLLLLPGRRQHIGAVVVLNPEGRAALLAQGKLPVKDALREWLRLSYEALLVPRKWRFPGTLPGNEMGKTLQQALLKLFEDKP